MKAPLLFHRNDNEVGARASTSTHRQADRQADGWAGGQAMASGECLLSGCLLRIKVYESFKHISDAP